MLSNLVSKALKVVKKLYHNYLCSNEFKTYLPPLGHFAFVISFLRFYLFIYLFERESKRASMREQQREKGETGFR